MMKSFFAAIVSVAVLAPGMSHADVFETFKCESTDLLTDTAPFGTGRTAVYVEVISKATPAGMESTAGAYTVDLSRPSDRRYFGTMDDLTPMLSSELYRPSQAVQDHTEFNRTGSIGILTTATLSINGWYENIKSYLCRKQ
ncbi:MAG: hypothetical protein JNL01_03495 [Bdellovibrionales bacterium]|nr:hypothetical protein [Bdellovibrionales bacterium]